jgi:hypothetical protein
MPNRITIQTTEELDRALEEARRATRRNTKSEVIRDGLELYDLVIHHLMAGKHLYLGTTRESAGEVRLPHLEHAASQCRPSLSVVTEAGDDAQGPEAPHATPVAQGVDAHVK